MEANEQKLIERLQSTVVGKLYTLILDEKCSCKYKIDWLTVTNMMDYKKGAVSFVKVAVRIVDGDVIFERGHEMCLTVDTMLKVSDTNQIDIHRYQEGRHYDALFSKIESNIQTTTRIFGFPRVRVMLLKITKDG